MQKSALKNVPSALLRLQMAADQIRMNRIVKKMVSLQLAMSHWTCAESKQVSNWLHSVLFHFYRHALPKCMVIFVDIHCACVDRPTAKKNLYFMIQLFSATGPYANRFILLDQSVQLTQHKICTVIPVVTVPFDNTAVYISLHVPSNTI